MQKNAGSCYRRGSGNNEFSGAGEMDPIMTSFTSDMEQDDETAAAVTIQRGDTRGDEVFEKILGLILNCELAPGDVVNESALATLFGVSRGPVREAIRRLQGIQLVTREPYFRARVVTLSPEGVTELFQTREALEGYACRLATENMPVEALETLEADLVAALGSASKPAERFDFHERVVRAGGNQRIINILCGDLYHLLRIYRHISGAVPERKEVAFQEHWQILRAMKNRDTELAESLMRSHIRRAGQHVQAASGNKAGR